MSRLSKIVLCSPLLLALVNCASVKPNSVKEVADTEVRGCKTLGPVNGSDAIFVGLSAAVGSKNAKARAMNQAIDMNATHVVWSQMGTSMTSEWVGKAYQCK